MNIFEIAPSIVAVSGRNPAEVQFWNWREGKHLHTIPEGGNGTSAFAAPLLSDGRLLLLLRARGIFIGHLDNWASAALVDKTDGPFCVLLTRDDSFITANKINGEIKVWRNEACVMTFQGGWTSTDGYHGCSLAIVGSRVVAVGSNNRMLVLTSDPSEAAEAKSARDQASAAAAALAKTSDDGTSTKDLASSTAFGMGGRNFATLAGFAPPPAQPAAAPAQASEAGPDTAAAAPVSDLGSGLSQSGGVLELPQPAVCNTFSGATLVNAAPGAAAAAPAAGSALAEAASLGAVPAAPTDAAPAPTTSDVPEAT